MTHQPNEPQPAPDNEPHDSPNRLDIDVPDAWRQLETVFERLKNKFHKTQRDLIDANRELERWLEGGVTEELLRKNNGFIRIGKGCAIVRAEDIPVERTTQPKAEDQRSPQYIDLRAVELWLLENGWHRHYVGFGSPLFSRSPDINDMAWRCRIPTNLWSDDELLRHIADRSGTDLDELISDVVGKTNQLLQLKVAPQK
jgi:hypothetical protein